MAHSSPGSPSAPAHPHSARARWLTAAVFAVAALAVALGAMAAALRGTRLAAAGADGVVAVLVLALGIMLAGLRRSSLQALDSAARRERQSEESDRRAAALEAASAGRLNALARTAEYLVSSQLPAALNGGGAPPLPGAGDGVDHEAAMLCDRVATAVASGVAELRRRQAGELESSRLAVVALARGLQASAHHIQREATLMARRHPADPDVLHSSMLVDHAAAQQARRAQSLAVLCGEWPGQQWPNPLALTEVVRAAAARIVAYKRVTVSGEPDTAAAASAVEPLIHLVAELLANATQSSPPATQVLVTARTVQRGAVIEIDDCGVGMEEQRLEQAREVASGRKLVGLGGLGEIPQTGLAVVGQYVNRHGFTVDLMPSPYGGVRAVVLVPSELVENLDLEPAAYPAPQPPLMAAVQAVPLPATETADPVPATETGPAPATETEAALAAGPPAAPGRQSLPQRRSRRGDSVPGPSDSAGDTPAEPTDAAATSMARPWDGGWVPDAPGSPDAVPDAVPEEEPAEAGAWMEAYLSGERALPAAFDSPTFESLTNESPTFDSPSYGSPTFGSPTFGSPSFESPAFDKPAFDSPEIER